MPPPYKQKDTYKVNGKGILERFLEICGDYLSDVITPDIESELDLIDMNKVPSLYLNYIWEYLGSIPFAYWSTIDEKKFKRYFNGFKTQQELEDLSPIWTSPKNSPITLTEPMVRGLLKYAITLTKIRGTKLFFETIFRFYGYNCEVTDPIETAGNTDSPDGLDDGGNNIWYLGVPHYDMEGLHYDSGVKYDINSGCSQCIPVIFDIQDGDSTSFADTPATVPSMDSDEFIPFRKAIEAFFNRYTPYNVKPVIQYNGETPTDTVEIEVTQIDNIPSIYENIIYDDCKVLHYRVVVTNSWVDGDTRFRINGSTKLYNSGDIIEISAEGSYEIIAVADEDVSEIIEVIKIDLPIWYTLDYEVINVRTGDNTSSTNFSTDTQEIRVRIWAKKYYTVWDPDEQEVYTDSVWMPIKLVEGRAREVIGPTLGTYIFYFDGTVGGVHGAQKLLFQIEEYPIKQLALELTADPEYAIGYATPSVQTRAISSTPIVYRSKLSAVTNWPDSEELTNLISIVDRDTGNVYDNGTNFILRTGTHSFYLKPKIVPHLNIKLRRRIAAIIFENTLEHPTEFTAVLNQASVRIETNVLSAIEGSNINFPKVRLDISGISEPDYGIEVYIDGDYDSDIDAVDNLTWVNIFNEDTLPMNPGTYRLVSKQDPSKEVTFIVEPKSEPEPVIKSSRIVISPEYTVDEHGIVHWDTDTWFTNWALNQEGQSAVAKALPVKFQVKAYVNGVLSTDQLDLRITNSIGDYITIKTVTSGDWVTLTTQDVATPVTVYIESQNGEAYMATLYIWPIIPDTPGNLVPNNPNQPLITDNPIINP